ncbi:MAG: hypothetical protein WC866_06025 [Patescibacteria group bacterium]|jgi:hypothetical protein
MSELFIDPNVFDVMEGSMLPDNEPAKLFAAGLPARHPVKRLLTGGLQGLGRNKHVYGFLRLFSMVYELYLRSANDNGRLRTMAPLDQAAILHEQAEFLRLFPADILFRGARYDLHRLYWNARHAVDDMTRSLPPVHDAALHAFDQTVTDLVRTVRLTRVPPCPFNANSLEPKLVRAT